MSELLNSLKLSKALAVVALIAWWISLTQPAFILDTGSGRPSFQSGWYVLLMGWAGIGSTLGWYANLPFLFAISVLLGSAKLPWKSAAVAILLAIDTLRIDTFPGGGRADVIGYGVGSAIWFTSIGIAFLAVVSRNVGQRVDAKPAVAAQRALVLVTIVALCAWGALYGGLAYRTSQSRSAGELLFLPRGSVKVGDICRVSVADPYSLIQLDGPLEIRGKSHPLDAPATLLSWGIPVVRKGGYDYALSDPEDINSVFWKPARGPSAAILNLSEQSYGDEINASLTTADGKTTAFNQSWRRDGRKSTLYCPDYRPTDPGEDAPPRSLLISAIAVSRGIKPPKVATIGNAIPPVSSARTSPSIASARDVSASDTPLKLASDCLSSVQFDDKDPGAANLGYGGQQVLAIDDRRYLLTNNQPLSAFCSGANVYLYYAWDESPRGAYTLYIQRRSLEDFRANWTTATTFDLGRRTLSVAGQSPTIYGLQEYSDKLILRVSFVDPLEIIDLTLPLTVGTSANGPSN